MTEKKTPTLYQRVKHWFSGPPGPVGTSGIPVTWPANWFQLGYRVHNQPGNPVIEACVSAYAQTMAQLPGRHYAQDENGVKTYITGSRLARVLAQPNEWQTSSDFMLNLVYSLLTNGNAYWIGDASGGLRPNAIYLLDPEVTQAHRVRETGDVFYSTSGEFFEMSNPDVELAEGRVMIPERFIGHVRLHTPRDPLIGVSPVQNATASVAAHDAITGGSAAFFQNASRPSGFLSTEMDLSKDQMNALRMAWEDKAKDLNSGGVPILGSGMRWNAMTMNSQDAQLVEAWKMTVQDISRVYRVPPMLINNMENSTFDNAETLMRFWLSSGLGFMIKHVEKALARYYGLDARWEGVEYQQEVLLQADLKAQMDALGTGVTKGLLAPDEGRARLGLGPVEGGGMPRVQQQMVPLDWEQPDASPATSAVPPEENEETLDDSEAAFIEFMVRGNKDAA